MRLRMEVPEHCEREAREVLESGARARYSSSSHHSALDVIDKNIIGTQRGSQDDMTRCSKKTLPSCIKT